MVRVKELRTYLSSISNWVTVMRVFYYYALNKGLYDVYGVLSPHIYGLRDAKVFVYL